MKRTEAYDIANRLGQIRPDRGNRYESRTSLTKKRGAFAQWQLTCRTVAYLVCVTRKSLSEAEFYAACGYDQKGA